nr:MAG TPA: hypothetical protein [Caudoviricetes sp.]
MIYDEQYCTQLFSIFLNCREICFGWYNLSDFFVLLQENNV